MKKVVSEDWLNRLNREFRKAGIEQRRRPWDAIRRYATEFKISVDISSDVAKQIFEWFKAHSKPGAHQIGSLYESVYFYDAQFWSVEIPISYGTVQLNALQGLPEMPENIKNELMSDPRQAWDYVIFWADCVDYGFGLDDLRKTSGLDAFGMQLLMSGAQELRTSTSILKQHRPDGRAILTARMAVEIFFKAYLALKTGLTERQAKDDIGHDLHKALDKFVDASGHDDWKAVRSDLSLFPPLGERYKEQDMSHDRLWRGFAMAQSLGALIVREHTDRNMLEQVLASNKVT